MTVAPPRPPEHEQSREPPRGAFLRLYPALATPTFRWFWLGMLPASLAWQMSLVAVPYAAFVLDNSATVLGVVSLASGVPLLLFSLLGGVVADRFPRRRVLLATQCALGLAAAGLAALALGGVLQVWHLVVYGVVQGVAMAFNMPTRQAYMGEVVPRPHLRSAIALNNAGLNFCRIAGPAVAGALLAVPAVGAGGVFLGMATMYAFVLAALLRLPHGVKPTTGDARPGGWANLVEGLRYIARSPTLLTLLGLGFAVLFFGMPFQSLMPLFAERVFDVGAAGLGVLMTAVGVGALAGSLTVAALAQMPRPALLQAGFGVGFGLALAAFALAPAFGLAIAVLLAVGFLSAGFSALNNTLVMGNSEPRLYGRVMSVYLVTYATMPIGAMPLAWLAEQFGGRLTIAGAGLLVAAIVAGVWLLRPSYRRIS